MIQNKRIVVVAAVVLIAIGFSFVLIQPRWIEGSKVNASINQYQAMLVEKERRVRNLTQDKKDFEELAASYEKVRASFFTYDDALSYVINNLMDIVKNSGVNYTALSIKPVKPIEDGLSDFAVGLDVEGKYADVRKLIDDLEGSDKALYLENYSINSKTVAPVTVGCGLVIHLLCITKTDKKD